MNPLRVAIVHYHRRPGGVTRVIDRTLAALEGSPVRAVALDGGPPDAPAAPDRATVPGLDYDPAPATAGSVDRLLADLRTAARRALDGPPDLWHVHNHSLARNPSLAAAVARLARDGERLLLQPHDFAEDGRPDRYRVLASQSVPGLADPGTDWWFPQGAHIHYAALTGRDASFLSTAGFDPARVHVLPNPVWRDDEAAPRDALSGKTPGGGRPLALYPTRAIRRKNLAEFLLAAVCLKNRFRFAVTLAPTSDIDLPYYRAATGFASRHGLPVEFEAGPRHAGGFTGLLRQASLVASTSVAEGFGLAFLEPWLHDRPVAGRDLPDITRDFRLEGIRLDALYASWPVPPDLFDETGWRRRLAERMRDAWQAYARPLPADAPERAADAASSREGIDFGRLDETAQFEVLERVAANPRVAARLRLPGAWTADVEASALRDNRRAVEERYSPAAYRARLLAVYGRLASAEPDAHAVRPPPRSLLDSFLFPERFVALRANPERSDDRLRPKEVSRSRFQVSSGPYKSTSGISDADRRRWIRAAHAGRPDPAPIPAGLAPRLTPLPGVRLLVCDVYGTLIVSASGDVGTTADAPADWNRILKDAGIEMDRPLDPAAAAADIRALIEEDHRRRRADGADWPEVEIRDIWRQWTDRLLSDGWLRARPGDENLERAIVGAEAMINPSAPMPGVETAIRALHHRGVALGILSNAQFYTAPLLGVLLPDTWDGPCFPGGARIWSFEEGLGKPSAGFYERAGRKLNALGYKPGDIAMIGNDLDKDIRPARRLGWRTILFAGDRRSLRPATLNEASDAPDADAVVTHWSQVPSLFA